MKYEPKEKNVICAITYGSRLYGTQTPASDYDFKAVYLPTKRQLLLSKRLDVLRHRFDANGNTVSESSTMPDGGWESEHTPLHKFVGDWFSGQAYAVEMVYAVLQGYAEGHADWFASSLDIDLACTQAEFRALCQTLVKDFRAKNVQGMVGFAVKQTFDYVRRGERLNAARAVLGVVLTVLLEWHDKNRHLKASEVPAFRLDTIMNGESIMDRIARNANLEMGTSENAGKMLRTLKLNGREYLETTAVSHFEVAVHKLIEQYGERSTKASETDVDWKSMSHAVRVYQQVIEYLETGWITFPRPNAANLLAIKSGQHSMESVKDLLRDLDDQVQDMLKTSELPDATEAQRSALDDVLYRFMSRHVRDY